MNSHTTFLIFEFADMPQQVRDSLPGSNLRLNWVNRTAQFSDVPANRSTHRSGQWTEAALQRLGRKAGALRVHYRVTRRHCSKCPFETLRSGTVNCQEVVLSA